MKNSRIKSALLIIFLLNGLFVDAQKVIVIKKGNAYPYGENDLDNAHNEIVREKEEQADRIQQHGLNDYLRKRNLIKNNRIKAVIVVGDVQEKTNEFIERMKKAEGFLKANFVDVHTFYFPNCKWEDIKKAASDASIFIFSGHGSGVGFLTNEHIYNDQVEKDLKLRKNSLVIFNHTCFAAGSSSSDFGDIGIEETENRVNAYAKAFTKAGAGCYYADNYEYAAYEFLKKFYEEKSIKECYELGMYYYDRIEKFDICSFDPNLMIGLSGSEYYGYMTKNLNGFEMKGYFYDKSYLIAFVARRDYCLKDLLINNKRKN